MAIAAATEPSTALIVGAATSIVAILGVEPQALVWAMVGAIFGAPLAPASGRVRQVLVFAAVVLSCALFGHWAADAWWEGSLRARNVMAWISAAVFHPASSALVSVVPEAIRTLVLGFVQRRSGGAQPPKGGDDQGGTQ
jgi:hypothetical protein